MADGSAFKAPVAAEAADAEGLPLHPVIESLSAGIGRYLAQLEFARQQAAAREDEAA